MAYLPVNEGKIKSVMWMLSAAISPPATNIAGMGTHSPVCSHGCWKRVM